MIKPIKLNFKKYDRPEGLKSGTPEYYKWYRETKNKTLLSDKKEENKKEEVKKEDVKKEDVKNKHIGLIKPILAKTKNSEKLGEYIGDKEKAYTLLKDYNKEISKLEEKVRSNSGYSVLETINYGEKVKEWKNITKEQKEEAKKNFIKKNEYNQNVIVTKINKDGSVEGRCRNYDYGDGDRKNQTFIKGFFDEKTGFLCLQYEKEFTSSYKHSGGERVTRISYIIKNNYYNSPYETPYRDIRQGM